MIHTEEMKKRLNSIQEETTLEEVVHRIREGTFYDDYDWAAGPALRALDKALQAEFNQVPVADNWSRTRDGKLRPFISEYEYDQLRDDDKFLYNRGKKPEGLV